MRTAPPVSVHCTGGLMWRCLQTLLAALAAGVFAVWLLAHASWHPWLVAWLVCDGVALAAWWAWHAAYQPSIALVFDGQVWTVNAKPGVLAVMMDLGPWLLLRLRPDAASAMPSQAKWIAVSYADAGPAMHALRAALYARQPRNKTDAPEQAGGAALGDVGRHV
jgi:hypothetical protein